MSDRISDESPDVWQPGESEAVKENEDVPVRIAHADGFYRAGQRVVTFLKHDQVIDVQVVEDPTKAAGPMTKEPAKYETAMVNLANAVASRL